METQTQLSPDELRSRLRFDYQVVKLMSCPLMEVEAYRNLDDLEARCDAITSEEEGHLATHYRVDYHLKTLIGRGRYSDKTAVRLDLFINNNYPFSEPAGFVLDGEKTPWSPHFLEKHHICIGKIWELAKGSMLLGELMVHIAKLLNFDEPEYKNADYGGWNPEAIEYWETALNRQPLSDIIYPPLPAIVHGVPSTVEQLPKTFVRKSVTGSSTPAIRLRPSAEAEIKPTLIRFKSHN
jgi:hypothetical protein